VVFIAMLAARSRPRAQAVALQICVAIALACRIVLQFVPGGLIQVIAGTVGVIAIFSWLAVAAVILGDVMVLGTAWGVSISTLTDAALGTWGAVWRADGGGWSLLVLQVLLVVASHRRSFAAGAGTARTGWLVMPVVLIAGIVAFNAGRASAIAGIWGLACIAAGCLAALSVTRLPVRRSLGWFAAIVLTGSVAAILRVTADVNGITDASP